MNEFVSDDQFQREKRDKYVLPWYGSFADATVVDKDPEFQKMGIDTILVHRKNRHVFNIEEKIVRWPGYRYDAFCLETESCILPGYETPGWMVYGSACRLLYCFAQNDGTLNCYWMDFKKLKDWFWQHDDEFPVFQMKERNKTRGRVVPIKEVFASVGFKNFPLRG